MQMVCQIYFAIFSRFLAEKYVILCDIVSVFLLGEESKVVFMLILVTSNKYNFVHYCFVNNGNEN